ncbi:Rrf2 family transcriptional regulator [Phenylobacterium sp.]|uniref:RrF2 family transcriptional regulator n=1 Tax=Phenylobacterium sp. TaxID=1871053 RepID=UPI0027336CF8|nr:Rrf2 family transcriptional regulator [Phenylobacterium sp.]MDP3173371.1 Rrf2 family transcriptional regulator [Phenylobacterium sp.]MDP3659229.1 Rrf2 family transcriptional regulator [Phenylobacterium sp.]
MLSQRGRYALKALINLARLEQGSRQVSAIAAEENIPRKFLEAIMSDMRRAHLVESARGKMGGYKLARPADLITFGDVIRITDGPLALIPCASRNFYRRCDDCHDEGACILRRIMSRVRNEVSEILDRTTLADALAGLADPLLIDEDELLDGPPRPVEQA